MLTFVVFDTDGVDAAHFPPRHAYLVGPENTPIPGTVKMLPGLVTCEKTIQQTVGLAVQLELERSNLGPSRAHRTGERSESLGLLTLQTCLLPDRPEPYLLSLELARHQIMCFLNKLEDWQMSDLSSEHPVMQSFEAARAAFTRALVAQRALPGTPQALTAVHGFSREADKLATQSLALALEAGESLALLNAERQLKQRLSGQGYKAALAHLARLTPEVPPPGASVLIPGAGHTVLPNPPYIGCSITPTHFSEVQQRAVQSACDFVQMPVRWSELEATEGKYNFTPTDRWIEWAVTKAKMPVFAGPIIDFRAAGCPDWLYIWENDYETLRDLVMEHVQAVVTRYRRTVQRWTVASGLHVNTNFKISFEQIMDLTRLCVAIVKKLHPTAKVQLEVAEPWGEYHTTNRRSIPPFLYAEACISGGLPLDAIGIAVQMGHATPGTSTRDLLQFSSILDKFGTLEKPLAVTCLGCPSQVIVPQPYLPRAGAEAGDSYEPGNWHEPFSEQRQADWLAHAIAIAASKPFVHHIAWQELTDPTVVTAAPTMPHGGLMGPAGQLKPSHTRLAQVRGSLRDGRWPLALDR